MAEIERPKHWLVVVTDTDQKMIGCMVTTGCCSVCVAREVYQEHACHLVPLDRAVLQAHALPARNWEQDCLRGFVTSGAAHLAVRAFKQRHLN